MISKINTSGLLKVVLAVFLVLFSSSSSYSNKPNQHSSVSENHSVTDSLNKNASKSEKEAGKTEFIEKIKLT